MVYTSSVRASWHQQPGLTELWCTYLGTIRLAPSRLLKITTARGRSQATGVRCELKSSRKTYSGSHSLMFCEAKSRYSFTAVQPMGNS